MNVAKNAALLLLTATLAGCLDQKDPWDYVTAGEKRQFFMQCIHYSPPGNSSVAACGRAADSWAWNTGRERMRADRDASN